MQQEEVETFEADVLVIGGGSAGYRAALSARESGASVLVVNGGGKTYGGATSYLDKLIELTGLAVAMDDEDVQRYYEELVDFGLGANERELVKTVTQDSEKELHFLESIGMEFKRGEEPYDVIQIPSHSRPRVVKGPHDFGTKILSRLSEKCDEQGVDMLTQTKIYDVVKDDSGRPRWAFGIKKVGNASKPIQIRFSSVVLATGGFGNLFTYATNPMGNASGMAIGFQLGATMTNLEFMHVLPLLTQPIKGFYLVSSLMSRGDVTNTDGESFRTDTKQGEGELDTVSQGNVTFEMCQWIEKQYEKGKTHEDGSVYWHGDQLIEDMKKRIPRSLTMLKDRGLDLTKQPARVSPGFHQALGGILIGPDGETNIPGLYACGECAGGFHGARRMMGTGVVDSLVFGSKAGHAAAQAVGSGTENRWIEMKEESDHSSPQWLDMEGLKRLQTIMDRILVIKSEDKLVQAQRDVYDLQQRLEREDVDSMPYKYRLRFSELNHAVTMAQAFIASSLSRKESRGSFVRRDYPEQTDAWAEPSRLHKQDPVYLQVCRGSYES